MSELIEVAPVSEVKSGERCIVTAEGRSIGVFNVDGEYFAIANTCLHEGGPVCEGKQQGALVGKYLGPGKRVKEEFSSTPAIACPWHGWEYDLTTGKHLGDPEVSLPTYDVIIENEIIHVEI